MPVNVGLAANTTAPLPVVPLVNCEAGIAIAVLETPDTRPNPSVVTTGI